MPSTTNRGYEVPITGTEVDTWGNVLNNNFGLIDSNFGAIATVALSSSDVTLNPAQYACGTIVLTGTITTNIVVTFPAVAGWWTVDNQTTGDFYISLRTAANAARVAAIPGEAVDVLADGSNMKYRNLGIPIGGYWDYAGIAVPNWVLFGCTVPPFLLCGGGTYSSVTYPKLFAILGTTTLPDSLGRSRANLNSGTGRITTAGSGINGDVRFSAGGGQNVPVSQANLPSVNFTVFGSISVESTAQNVVRTASGGGFVNGVAGTAGPWSAFDGVPSAERIFSTGPLSGLASSGGSGTPVNNMQPTYIGGITMIRAA